MAAYSDSMHACPSGRYFAVATSFDRVGGDGFSYGNINPGVYVIDTQTGDTTRVIDKSGVYVSGWLGE